MICLETSAVIAAINHRPSFVRTRLEQALGDGAVVGIPAVVLFELWYGLRKSARPPQHSTATLATFLTLDVTLWPFEPPDAEEAGDIRASLERAGTPIGAYDVLVAAQARRRGAVLATAQARTFARVPRLSCEDWAAPV
jgi:tRNA(fMet)-specific endonuclease VapC